MTRNPFRVMLAVLLIFAAGFGSYLYRSADMTGSSPPGVAETSIPAAPPVVQAARLKLRNGKLTKGFRMEGKRVLCGKGMCAAFNNQMIAVGRDPKEARSRLANIPDRLSSSQNR